MIQTTIALALVVRAASNPDPNIFPPFYELALRPAGATEGEPADACGNDIITSEARCAEAHALGGYVSYVTYNIPVHLPGCSVVVSMFGGSSSAMSWNQHPVGARPPGHSPICETAPAPTPGSMSGDPIINVNGYKIKFDLPFKQASLLWGDDTLQVYGKADVATPDLANQWFSEINLASNGHQFASITTRKIRSNSKAALGSLNTLSVAISENSRSDYQFVTQPRSHSIGNGQIHVVVGEDGHTIGGLQREVVKVKSKLFDFTVAPEVAKKFSNAEKALKYVHLDITMQKMLTGATAGVLAEIFGFVPLTAQTARRIRSAKRATE